MKKKRFILLDNHVFQAVVRKPPFRRNLIENINQKVGRDKTSHYQFIIAPSLLVEYLGLGNIPRPVISPSSALTKGDPQSLIQYIYDENYKFYVSHSSLKQEALIVSAESRKSYLDKGGKEMLSKLVIEPLRKEYICSMILKVLTIDALCAFEFATILEAEQLRSTESLLVLFCFGFFSKFPNISFMRVALRAYIAVERIAKKHKDPRIRQFAIFRPRDKGVKPGGDLLDLDILHMVTMGYFLSKFKVPVTAITLDSEDQITKRLEASKRAIYHLRSVMRDLAAQHGQESTYRFGFRNGQVAFAEGNGSLRKILKVGTIKAD